MFLTLLQALIGLGGGRQWLQNRRRRERQAQGPILLDLSTISAGNETDNEEVILDLTDQTAMTSFVATEGVTVAPVAATAAPAPAASNDETAVKFQPIVHHLKSATPRRSSRPTKHPLKYTK